MVIARPQEKTACLFTSVNPHASNISEAGMKITGYQAAVTNSSSVTFSRSKICNIEVGSYFKNRECRQRRKLSHKCVKASFSINAVTKGKEKHSAYKDCRSRIQCEDVLFELKNRETDLQETKFISIKGQLPVSETSLFLKFIALSSLLELTFPFSSEASLALPGPIEKVRTSFLSFQKRKFLENFWLHEFHFEFSV